MTSDSFPFLHSHSGLERKLLFPKNKVLVDVKYKDLFVDGKVDVFKNDGIEYLKVPILLFVNKGGVFRNFER